MLPRPVHYSIKCHAAPFLIAVILLASCARRNSPYADGPVMSVRQIRSTFSPVLDFLEIKKGIHFADVGAGSGAITVMMSSLMDSSTIYIQDIDTKVLNKENLDKIIRYYTNKSNLDLRAKNKYEMVIGDATHTLLPEASLDLIYSNATIHVFDEPSAMLQDLKTKLKPGGRIFIRDSFQNDNGEGEFCSDKTCAKRLLSIPEFLELMEANGYKLVKQSPNLSGYPVFGFEVAQR